MLRALLFSLGLMALGFDVGVSYGRAHEPMAESQAPAALAAPQLPGEQQDALIVTHADAAFARDFCRSKHLAWSRMEVSTDGSTVGIHCESTEVIEAQVQAHWAQRGESR